MKFTKRHDFTEGQLVLLEVIRDASSANGLSCQHLNFIQLTGPLPHLVSMLRALSAGTNVGGSRAPLT